jgi:hypothetical protein
MTPITGTFRPNSLNTVERETVFNLETLFSAIYSKPPTTTYPHVYEESQAVYAASVMTKRQIPTPDGRMRVIYTIAFQVDPMMGFNANGVWNHVLPMAQDLEF